MLFSDLRRGIDRSIDASTYLSSFPCRRHRDRRGSEEGWPGGPPTPWLRRASHLPWIALSVRLSLDLHARTGRSVATSRSLASLHTPVRDDGRCSSKRVRRARGAVVGLETWEGIGTGEPIDGAIYRRKMRRLLLFCWTRRPNFQQIFRF